MPTVAIAADLFEESPGGTCLVGGRGKSDGRIVFPYPSGAEAERFDRIRLARTGRLWSWTVQRFPPKTPPYVPSDGPFQPYAVGYVELPEIIVEARLAVADFADLAIGLEMEVTQAPYRTAADGSVVTTFAFKPRANGDSA